MAETYTQDWFSNNVPVWEKYVIPNLPKGAVHWLEVGCYEGRSTLWTLRNALTHPESRITCVDAWSTQDQQRAKVLFMGNLRRARLEHKVQTLPIGWMTAIQFLATSYDAIYLDADHRAEAVVMQTILLWPRLRPTGLLIFDDYGKVPEVDQTALQAGIDAIMLLYAGRFELIHKGYQVILRKLN